MTIYATPFKICLACELACSSRSQCFPQITSVNRCMRDMLRYARVDQVGNHYFFLNWKSIYECIADRRAKALIMHRADIQAFALAIDSLDIFPKKFKASQHWLDGFLQ